MGGHMLQACSSNVGLKVLTVATVESVFLRCDAM
jgi:hypothetical protein